MSIISVGNEIDWSCGTQNISYDANGNMLTDYSYTYTYNDFNQLETVSQAGSIIEKYFHDADGNKIMKVEFFSGGANITTIYYREYVVTVNGSKVSNETYYYVQGKLVASYKDTVLKYFFTDHLGSTRFVANSTGYIEDRYEYMPFGASVQDTSRYMYTGKELDDTGLEYYGARYYDPQLSRFTQPDSIIPDPYNPQNLNRYAYVLNNPYKYVDEKGNFAFVPIAIGAAIGGGVGAVTYMVTHDHYTARDFISYTAGGAVAGGAGAISITAGIIGGVISEVANNYGHYLVTNPNSNNACVNSGGGNQVSEGNHGSESNHNSNQQQNPYHDLQNLAEQNSDKTAGEIISEWKNRQNVHTGN